MRKVCFLIILLAAGLFCLTPAAVADWSPAQRLTWTSGVSYLSAIAVDSSNAVHVVWEDDTPGNYEIYYKRSTDGGTAWSAAQRLTWTTGVSHRPAIAVDSSNAIHIVWEDDTPGNNEIYYKRSTDAGATWGAAQRLTWTSTDHAGPDIAVDSSDSVHVVWHDDMPNYYEIYYKRSTDGGATWGAAQRLTWTPAGSYWPSITTDAGTTIHVSWQDYAPGDLEIYYKKSTDGGTTWGPAQRISYASGFSSIPAIAMKAGNTVHIAWEDQAPGNSEIYYKRSTDGGATWGAAQRLTWTSSYHEGTALAVDTSNVVHLVWTDDTAGHYEIHYKRSTDGGITWSAPQRLTWIPWGTRYPDIATDSTNAVHVVWGIGEIYYKKGT